MSTISMISMALSHHERTRSHYLCSVSETDWTGGPSYYSSLEEGAIYYTARNPHHLLIFLTFLAGSYWFVSTLYELIA